MYATVIELVVCLVDVSLSVYLNTSSAMGWYVSSPLPTLTSESLSPPPTEVDTTVAWGTVATYNNIHDLVRVDSVCMGEPR